MKIYKVVPCAKSVVVNKKEPVENAITKYFDIIKHECVDGWEFHSTAPVVITRKLGKFKNREETFNAFVFVKDVK
jgi:hypothetical protein